jgi:hypothetical protein
MLKYWIQDNIKLILGKYVAGMWNEEAQKFLITKASILLLHIATIINNTE